MASVRGAKRVREALRTHALAFPGAAEDFPWGDCTIKVDGKIFLFLGDAAISLKLPCSCDAAMGVRDAKPTPYGLGKAGWVSFPIDGELPPIDVLREWIEESYRAIAKKRRLKQLDPRERSANPVTVSAARTPSP